MSALITQQVSTLATKFAIPDTGDLISVLKSTAFKGNVSDAQMSALLIVANQYGLNPWTKEIYAFPDKNNGIVPVVGVDGWSRIINENPLFDGMDFEQSEESCTCIIYRKDRSHPTKVTEYMSECKRPVGPWQSHPKRMLRHKAMIQCARLAFGFVGIHDQDEAERILEKDIPPGRVTPTTVAQAKQHVASDGPSDDLLAAARNAADNGKQAFGAFWKTIKPADRSSLRNDMADLEKRCKDADERTVEAAPAAPIDDDFVKDMDAHTGEDGEYVRE